jgi:hypothetical protein
LISLCFFWSEGVDASSSRITAGFDTFVARYSKTYATEEERAAAFDIFASNYMFIDNVITPFSDYRLELNKFADLSTEFFKANYLGYVPSSRRLDTEEVPEDITDSEVEKRLLYGQPASFDWDDGYYVDQPQDQGQCSSSYALVAASTVASFVRVYDVGLFRVSPQWLIDCTQNQGCAGGDTETLLNYITARGGSVCDIESYPYNSRTQRCFEATCRTQSYYISHITPTSFATTRLYSPSPLVRLVANMPVPAAVRGDSTAFKLYRDGVLPSDACGTGPVNQAVLVVGYGTKDGKNYWKIKNSWGTDWGMNGYALIERNRDRDGQCGILLAVTYPNTLKGKAGIW